MSLPFFYSSTLDAHSQEVVLDEDTSKHIVQVMRMENNEKIKLTNGLGTVAECMIADNNRKRCTVSVIKTEAIAIKQPTITIAISPTKNHNRFEWFLEKATEIGVTAVVPLICERTAKTQLKPARLQQILISAMLQSQQGWLPLLSAPVKFSEWMHRPPGGATLMAHCDNQEKRPLSYFRQSNLPVTILIGPEGDFSAKEIAAGTAAGFEPVSLGHTRLRTETAGIVAASILMQD